MKRTQWRCTAALGWPKITPPHLLQEKSHYKTAATKTGRRLASTYAWPEPIKKRENTIG